MRGLTIFHNEENIPPLHDLTCKLPLYAHCTSWRVAAFGTGWILNKCDSLLIKNRESKKDASVDRLPLLETELKSQAACLQTERLHNLELISTAGYKWSVFTFNETILKRNPASSTMLNFHRQMECALGKNCQRIPAGVPARLCPIFFFFLHLRA